jgi:branched-chain amino acid transport system substrate-binding protein
MRLTNFTRAALAVCCAMTLASCGQGSSGSAGASGGAVTGNVVTIGVDLPLSGADAAIGQSTLNGVTLAVEQANAKGLPGGLTLKVDALDDAVQGVHSPQQGVANTRTLISQPNVLAMIGPYNSNVGKAEIPVTNAAGLAQISPATTTDSLTKGPDGAALRRTNPDVIAFFRVCAMNSEQGLIGAQLATSQGWKTAYVVDDNETYGLDMGAAFSKYFTKDGGKIVGSDHLEKNSQDYKSLLLKIGAAKPDVLFYGGVSSTGGGLLRKQMFDTGLSKLPMLGGDGINDLNTIAGKEADGVYYTVGALNADKLASAKEFVKTYAARFKEPVGPYSANAFAATQIAIAAIVKAKAAGSLTRAAVLKNVAATSMPTVIGQVSFDKDGDIASPVISVYQFKNGQPFFLKQINV